MLVGRVEIDIDKSHAKPNRKRLSLSLSLRRMATHVVSWGGNEHIVSSSTPSIVSMDSISSAVHEAAHSSRSPESWVTRTNSLTKPNGSETSTSSTYPGADATSDGSFIRHHKYFFKDGNLTFLVRGVPSQP